MRGAGSVELTDYDDGNETLIDTEEEEEDGVTQC